jgi:acyl dehydratase
MAEAAAASADKPENRAPRRVVQRGLWFEELEVGTVYEHRPGRTVSEADNILFSTLTMNHQALHLDAVFAAEQTFGQRLMNSMFTLSVLVGLSANQLTQGTLVANLGFSEVSFPKPLFHGDTLYGETAVSDKRPSSSRPGEGVVTFEHVGRNQYGVVVARANRVMLVRMRPDSSAVDDDLGGGVPDGGVPDGGGVSEARG